MRGSIAFGMALLVGVFGIAPAASSSPPATSSTGLEALPEADQNRREAERAWDDGVAAYETGDLDAAIAHFEDAYRFSGRPGLLFSIAQAHRHLFERDSDPRQRLLAIKRYQQYIEADAGGKRIVEAERYLGELASLSELELEGLGDAIFPTRMGVAKVAPGATLRIDGGEPFALPATPDVAPGHHEIEVQAPGFHPWRGEVTVPEGSTVTVQVELAEIEAKLDVVARAGSDVYVDGERKARLPLDRPISVPSGIHQVGIARPGSNLIVRNIELTRGQNERIEADLEVTNQRKLAYAAFAIGGGGVVASGVLVGLSVDATRRARRIEDEREAGSVPLSEDLRRREIVAARDDRRTAAIATGVGGGLFLATALVLFFTDRPPVASILRPRAQAKAHLRPLVGNRIGLEGSF